MKVMTIVGTRPELIRLSRIIVKLDSFVDHILVHTGQNYDYELNGVFFKELEIREPDYFLNVNNSSLGKVLGEIISKTEEVLIKEKPDAVLILGDTNSSLAAIIAKRMKIPIYHMEAGNRCFDLNVPEEINRRIVDHIADFNLVYTEHARRHLISEGLPHRRIYLTGSPMLEVINFFKPQVDASRILDVLSLQTGKYFLSSTHREENVDNPDNLKKIIIVLNILAEKYNFPIIVSTHPRTRKILDNFVNFNIHKNIVFAKPFGFLDYIKLQQNAFCVISDSGTISEESAILHFPAITIRNAMERPEAIDAGTIVLTGLDSETILKAIELNITLHGMEKHHEIPQEYKIDNTSIRVLKLIIGTAKLSNKWFGIENINNLNYEKK